MPHSRRAWDEPRMSLRNEDRLWKHSIGHCCRSPNRLRSVETERKNWPISEALITQFLDSHGNLGLFQYYEIGKRVLSNAIQTTLAYETDLSQNPIRETILIMMNNRNQSHVIHNNKLAFAGTTHRIQFPRRLTRVTFPAYARIKQMHLLIGLRFTWLQLLNTTQQNKSDRCSQSKCIVSIRLRQLPCAKLTRRRDED